MKIALIQQHATTDTALNVRRGLDRVDAAADRGAECAVFAELAFTRFFPQFHRDDSDGVESETVPGPTTELFCAKAREHRMVIIPNLYERDAEGAYDSSPVIDADGTLLGTTRMVHVADYDLCFEKEYYTPGNHGASVYDTAVGKIGVAICYDRHFPEYMRALGVQGAQLVVVPQAGTVGEWPAGLYEAELQVASFHNGYFCALANRVGKEDALEFSGQSFVTNPSGEVIAQSPSEKDDLLIVDIDLDEVKASPARTLFFRDRRPEVYPLVPKKGA